MLLATIILFSLSFLLYFLRCELKWNKNQILKQSVEFVYLLFEKILNNKTLDPVLCSFL